MARIHVLVPAAGSGSRFGGALPKQFLPLDGKPIIQHVIERFLRIEAIDKVVVAVAEPLLAGIQRGEQERVLFVAGGETRQQSVARAFEASGECDLVAIHDAARPLFSDETLAQTFKACLEPGAALPVLPVSDTIHIVQDETIVSTPDRSTLFAAQTPQCFRYDVLKDILARAAEEQFDGTDEAGLAVRYGYTVKTVPGDAFNIKVTRAEDLSYLEWLIQQGSKESPS